MAYAQNGVIEATDYNNLVSGSNQVNSFWSTGTGDAGYGQTALPTVSAPNVVTATQWATLINAVNNARAHQTGNASVTGFSSVVAGDTVNYLSTLQTQVNAAYTDRLSYAAGNGATTTGGTFLRNVVSTTGLATWQVIDMQVTFASADQARYFFNAGGILNYVVGHNASGSGSAQSLGRVISAIGGLNLYPLTNSGRLGSGISLNANNASIGYYDLTTTPETVVFTTDTTASYTGSNSALQVFSYDGTETNGAKGYLVVFRLLYDVDNKTWDDSINLLINARIDIVAPESTYLTNSWGTPTSGITWSDIFNLFNRGQAGVNCTLSTDGATAGPFNNSVPMKMVQTGNDTHTATYNSFADVLSAASVGDQFRITYWAKASTNVTIEGAWLPNADSGGGYLSGSTYISGTVNGAIALTTSWQRFSTVWQVSNASTAYVQIRLDGTQSGGSGTTVWWDHLTLERVS